MAVRRYEGPSGRLHLQPMDILKNDLIEWLFLANLTAHTEFTRSGPLSARTHPYTPAHTTTDTGKPRSNWGTFLGTALAAGLKEMEHRQLQY